MRKARIRIELEIETNLDKSDIEFLVNKLLRKNGIIGFRVNKRSNRVIII